MPDARYSSTSETVICNPRIHGFLLRFPGQIVMIFEESMLYGVTNQSPADNAKTAAEQALD
jgi:hypothetical protein